MKQTARHLLCFPGLSHIIIQISDVMARFVTMYILPYQAGNINEITIHLRFYRKDRVERNSKFCLSTKQLRHSVHIVRHKEAVLPGRGFRVGTSYLGRIEGSFPVAIHPLTSEEPCRAIKYIDIVLGAFDVFLIYLFFSHRLSHTCNAPIIVSKL